MTKFIDTSSYYSYDLYKNVGESHEWLDGYDAGFRGEISIIKSEEYAEGYRLGQKDKEREERDPWIKGGRPYSNWYKPSNDD